MRSFQEGCFCLGPFLLQGLPGPCAFAPGRGQFLLDLILQALTLVRQEGDVSLLGQQFGLPFPDNIADGTEQNHVQEKDQEQEIDNLREQSPINVNHSWLPPRILFT